MKPAAIATFLYLLITSVQTIWHSRKVVIVDPISVPGSLSEIGYNSDVFRREVLGQIDTIEKEAKAPYAARGIQHLRAEEQLLLSAHTITVSSPVQELPEFEIPETGVSVRRFLSWVQKLLKREPARVNGDLTFESQGFDNQTSAHRFRLTLRVSHGGDELRRRGPFQLTAENPDALVAQVATEILHQQDPYVLAVYQYKHVHDWSAALKLLEETPPVEKDWGDLLRGLILSNQGNQAEAIAIYQKIITHKVPLDDIADAYHLFSDKLDNCIKPVLMPAGA